MDTQLNICITQQHVTLPTQLNSNTIYHHMPISAA